MLLEEEATRRDERARPAKKRKTRHDTVKPEPHSEHEHESKRLPLHTISTGQAPKSQLPDGPSNSPKLTTASQAQAQAQHELSLPSMLPKNAVTEARVRQTIIDSDESDESDMEWEDALAEGDESENERLVEREIGDISITLNDHIVEEKKAKPQVRRRAITSVDKKRRLDIHKMHVLCLLYHIHRRNAWCNDRVVQSALRKILPPKVLTNLAPNPDLPQYQASRRFIDGLNELKIFWSKRFSITARGMYKPQWADADAEVRPFSDFDELDEPMDLDDFRTAALKLHGSQDIGAQLFCALLRGIGVEARLLCSLQCLPFASAAQPPTPQNVGTQKNTITLDPYNVKKISPSRRRAPASPRVKRASRLEQAIGERHSALRPGAAPKQLKKYHAAYPVYWVEAYNSIHQKWVPIDPLSTITVNAPEKLEPPLNHAQNTLTYVVAYDNDYTAKDVTRRYAKAYNAKTRKFRVECTPGGDKWWKQAMDMFKRRNHLDRDQMEDAALARKVAAEGIPKNVQDFKNHPIYVLERHLRHNEVIHPLNQVGKVNVGSSMNPKMEPIYRRKDVHIVRSADKWYRLGRDVQDGEQPLKHAKPKKGRHSSIRPDMEIEDIQDEVGAGLYAEFQTEVYVPPPVIRGRVPRNAFGNLDLYVPSMCPPGGIHIRHKLASKAARIVGVDYAEAVTGFSFKGRHGTAIVQGVVVAQEFAPAVEALIDAMEYGQEEAENQQRRSEVLRLWRRFYLGLKIAQRVNAIEIDGQTGPVFSVQEEIDKEDKELAQVAFAGGFFPDEGDAVDSRTPGYEPPSRHNDYGGGFVPDEDEEIEDGGFIPEATHDAEDNHHEESQSFGSVILSQQQLRPRRMSSFGGGFMPNDDESESELSLNQDNHPNQGGSLLAASIGHSSTSPTSTLVDAYTAPSKTADEALSSNIGLDDPKPSNSVPSGQLERANEDIVLDGDKVEAAKRPIETPIPSSSPSDVGSLPLEDPEDEDAEPDWLVDAT